MLKQTRTGVLLKSGTYVHSTTLKIFPMKNLFLKLIFVVLWIKYKFLGCICDFFWRHRSERTHICDCMLRIQERHPIIAITEFNFIISTYYILNLHTLNRTISEYFSHSLILFLFLSLSLSLSFSHFFYFSLSLSLSLSHTLLLSLSSSLSHTLFFFLFLYLTVNSSLFLLGTY